MILNGCSGDADCPISGRRIDSSKHKFRSSRQIKVSGKHETLDENEIKDRKNVEAI